jgi:hypothetical protein
MIKLMERDERGERGFPPRVLVPPLRAPHISVDAVPTSIESIYKLATMHTLGAGLSLSVLAHPMMVL